MVDANQHPSGNSSRAVHKLAELLKQQHDDTWWNDFLSATEEEDHEAIEALSSAFIANVNDRSHEAITRAREAATLFAQHHNLAGELRARFEEVYGLQRGLSSSDCISGANELWRRVEKTRYRWLQTQTALEKATCTNWTFDFKTTTANIELSRSLAAKFGFAELGLRVTAIDAGIKHQQKRYDEAWKEAVGGLHVYWRGSYSPERLYQFYSVMRQCAKEMDFNSAARVLLLQTIAMREKNSPDDLSLKAMLYLHLANELRREGENALADQESARAVALVKQIPANEPTARRYVLLTQIESAELELQRGDRGDPLVALAAINSIQELLEMQDDFVNLDFYKVSGDIQRRFRHFDLAVSDYESAIEVAERSVRAITDEANRLQWLRAADETYRGLTQSLLDQGEARKALVAWERFKSRSLETPDAHNQYQNIREELSQAVLPAPSDAHLIYVSFKDSLQIWVVSGTVVKSHFIPVQQADLQQEINDFAQDCSNLNSAQEKIEGESEAIYLRLVKPVVGDLPAAGTVAVELDQPLTKLTMENLKAPDGTYFNDSHPVIYSPGLLAESNLRQPDLPRTQDRFLVVDTSTTSGNGHLPGHEMEQAAITSDFPQRSLITATDATPAKVLEALRTSVGFTFIGHARKDGTGTALVLTPSLSLKASDFSPDIMRNLRFAVLSACSSGSAQNGLLDNGNLVRSFLAARVPTIIASHWNVDSASTAQFMKSFYLHLAQGETTALALRDARKEMRSVKNHPYYWAGFSLNGRVS